LRAATTLPRAPAEMEGVLSRDWGFLIGLDRLDSISYQYVGPGVNCTAELGSQAHASDIRSCSPRIG
jgi:hypothetical protein